MTVVQSILHQQIEQVAQEARQAEEGGQYTRAASLYARLAEFEGQYVRYVQDPQAQARWRARAESHLQRAVQLAEGSPLPPPRQPKESAGQGAGEVRAAVSGDVASLLAIVDGLIVKDSHVSWQDIAGLDEAQREVKRAFGLALAKRPAGTDLPTWERLLLYGPPGTGKTLLAAAAAGSIPGSTFFNAQWSQLSSKWYGETAKIISLLYQRAREKAPAIVFMDEVDTVATSRDESGRHEASVTALNTLLQEMSGIQDKVHDHFVLTFAATNRPWALDDAFLSRFARAIYIPLPDPVARREIFRIHLEKKGVPVSASYEELAEVTEGYSGREIAALCTQAIVAMVEGENPGLMQAVDKGVDSVRSYSIQLRAVTKADIVVAQQFIRPMATPDLMRSYEEWRRQKGFV